ncbi:MAG: 5-oxoprolinase subunit PxpB [Clostridia bacterium]|nr:5-oxoprolinase subunit PxpB [Clostridia bacterium]
MKRDYTIKHAGDCGVTVEFENIISECVNQQVIQLKIALEQAAIKGMGEMIPTYRALLIQYNPLMLPYKELETGIVKAMDCMEDVTSQSSKVYIIPVYYGEAYGPDLGTVAKHNGISEEEVIQIHTSRDYRIYMLGFTPGFPYLGGMDARIETPRLEKPRTKIDAGSVGIAGAQTGIYPIDSPGGWQIIGRTPLKLFDRDKPNPILLEAGAYIRFKPVGLKVYAAIAADVEKGTYVPETVLTKGEA